MKSSFAPALALVAAAATPALAFPSYMLDRDLSAEELDKITKLAEKITSETVNMDGRSSTEFDAGAQLVDVTGDHAWQAPGDGDLRGPCPGLNSMANHGYISRTGVDTATNIIAASKEVFNMGLDLATFLTVYSTVMAGDLVSVSIGGVPEDKGLLDLAGGLLLGEPQGLSHSHNRFEADVSPTRADLYKDGMANGGGDAWSLDMGLFTELLSKPLGPNGYDLSVMTPWRGERFWNSVHTNPYFWNGPFTGLAVQTATYVFTYRYMANASAEYPDGYLSRETLQSFHGVSEDSETGEMTVQHGHDRIPDNFYRRAEPFGIAGFALDAVDALRQLPDLLVLGGNTGTVDSFTGLNVSSVTSGVFNAETLLDDNNLMCFAFQAASMGAPDILRGSIANLAKPLGMLSDALSGVLTTLGCPQLAQYDTAQFDQFPGAKGGY